MPSLDAEIRDSLERLTAPSGSGGVTLEDLRGRRRRRRTRRAVVAAVPILLVAMVGLGLLAASGDSGPDVSAGASQPASTDAGPRTVTRTEVAAEDGATTRVVMEFDQPLPADQVTYIADLAVVNLPTTALYTTQRPSQAQVCDATHDFGEIAVGTVDLLLPEGWFEARNETHTSPIDRIGEPPKFVVCGPHSGYYQYSIWGPASADPLDVAVTIAPDRLRLTVEIAPTTALPTGTSPSPINQDRSPECAALIRAADDSRSELQELDRAIETARKELDTAEDPQAAQTRLETLQARRGVIAAHAAEVTAEADALNC